jgi:single-strand DNA-binding protein
MNSVAIIGNLTRDPEVKYTPSGTAVCEVGIAVNEVWYNDKKEKCERVYFFGAVAWGNMAENIGKYFTKGQKIAITGSLTQETWEEKETQKKREKTKIKIAGFDFCGGGEKRDQAERPASNKVPDADPSWSADENDNVPL